MQFGPVPARTPQIPKNFAEIARPQPTGLPESMAQSVQPRTQPQVTPLQNMGGPVMHGPQMGGVPQEVNVKSVLERVMGSKKANKADLDVLMGNIKDRSKAESLLKDLERSGVVFDITEQPQVTGTPQEAVRAGVGVGLEFMRGLGGISVGLPAPGIADVAGFGFDVAQGLFNTVSSIPEIFKRRVGKGGEALSAIELEISSVGAGMYQTLMQGVGIPVDIVGTAFVEGLNVIDKRTDKVMSNYLMGLLNTPQGERLIERMVDLGQSYEEYIQEYPEEGRNIDAGLVALEIALDFAGVGGARRGAKAATTQFGDVVKRISTETPPPRPPTTPQVQQAITRLGAEEYVNLTRTFNNAAFEVGFKDRAVALATGLDPVTVKKFTDNKSLVVLGDLNAWDRENTIQHVLDGIETSISRYSEAGPAYRAIREGSGEVPTVNIQNALTDYMGRENINVRITDEGVNITFPATTKFTPSEQNLIREAALPMYQVQTDVVGANDVLNLRTRLTKAAAFDRNVTKSKDATDFIKGMRKAFNDAARKDIPGLEEADRIYAGIIDDLSGISQRFFKDGVQTTNVYNKVRSLLREPASNKERQALLRAIPDIEERMLYLDIMTDVGRTAGRQKTGPYATAFLGAGVGALLGGPVGGVMGVMAGLYFQTPDVIKALLKSGGTPKKAAAQILDKVKKREALLDSEKALIRRAIENANQRHALPFAPEPIPAIPEGGLPDVGLRRRPPAPEPPTPRRVTETGFPEFTRGPQRTQQDVVSEQVQRLQGDNLTNAPQSRIIDESLPTQPNAMSNITKVKTLNDGKDITLVRGTGGQGAGAGEALRGKGLYLTDNIDVARYYGDNLEYVTIKNADILDGSKGFTRAERKRIIESLPSEMKRELDETFDYNYESLIRTIEGNTGIEAEAVSEAINSALKNKYKGVKFSIGQVNSDLAEIGLGQANAFIIR